MSVQAQSFQRVAVSIFGAFVLTALIAGTAITSMPVA